MSLMHFIIFGILQSFTPKCLKSHFRDSEFQNFSMRDMYSILKYVDGSGIPKFMVFRSGILGSQMGC